MTLTLVLDDLVIFKERINIFDFKKLNYNSYSLKKYLFIKENENLYYYPSKSLKSSQTNVKVIRRILNLVLKKIIKYHCNIL